MITPFKTFLISIAAIAAFFLSGCAATPRKSEAQVAGPPAPPVVEAAPAESTAPTGDFVGPVPSEKPAPLTYGPTQVEVKRITVVFGAGGAKALGAAGVIKVLKQEKIPVQLIVGTEVSGAVSALYAIDGSVNSLEWKLKKIEWSEFQKKQGWISNFSKKLGGAEPRNYMKLLSGWAGEKRGRELKIPLAIVAADNRGKARIFSEEPVTQSVRAGLGRVDGIPPFKDGDTEWFCNCGEEAFPLRAIQSQLGSGPIIAVDFKDDGARGSRMESALSEAAVVIRPDLSGMTREDYEKQNEIIFRTEAATRAKIREIRLAAGLPEMGF